MNAHQTAVRALTLFLLIGLGAFAYGDSDAKTPWRPEIRYVSTPEESVEDMLWMARVGKDDIVYDLGSGDGRIVISAVKDFGARRAVGVEIDPDLVRESREKAKAAGVADRVEFIEGDLFKCDFSEATVVTLFLGHAANIELRPKLFRLLKPGSRVVSNQFGMGEWKPDRWLITRYRAIGMRSRLDTAFGNNPHVPDYGGYGRRIGTKVRINMWHVPVELAGRWEGTLETSQGPVQLCMELHQTVNEVNGQFSIPENPKWKGRIQFDVSNDNVRWFCMQEKAGYYTFNCYFEGKIRNDTMEGTVQVTENGETSQCHWTATREVVPLAGTWRWQHSAGDNRPLTLRVEQVGHETMATLTSRGQELPVADFYNFRGGIYFTYMFGSETRTITEDSGWLIGSAGFVGTQLKGGISFYSYHEKEGLWSGPVLGSRRLVKDWEPIRVVP